MTLTGTEILQVIPVQSTGQPGPSPVLTTTQAIANLASPASNADRVVKTLTVSNTLTLAPQFIVAAGSNSRATAAPIALAGGPEVIVVTVSASSRGVTLPAASPGLRVELFNEGTHAVHVYPASNAKIGVAATNASVSVANNKGGIFVARSATQWALMLSA